MRKWTMLKEIKPRTLRELTTIEKWDFDPKTLILTHRYKVQAISNTEASRQYFDQRYGKDLQTMTDHIKV